MQVFFGNLSVRGLTSFLMPDRDWLLLHGFPDPEQAGRAATNLVVNVRHLPNGASVAVTGTRGVIGTQPVIIMSDINEAGPLMAHAVAGVASNPQAARLKPPSKGRTGKGGKGKAAAPVDRS